MSLFRLHLRPFLGEKELGEISAEVVRAWRSKLLATGRSEMTTAKAYRLRRTTLTTAVDDGRIKRNPCRIKGADKEYSPERPVASIQQVCALADAVGGRFRVMILAAAFTGLRWGELVGLRRRDVDLATPSVRVPGRLAQLASGEMVMGPTKSVAGFRTVALPQVLVPDMSWHLAEYVADDPGALVFTGAKGAMVRRGNWRRAVKWSQRIVEVGLPVGFHFHDLRHTGNHLAALSGATTRELMHRMGHGSVRAAMIYQHATSERDREIAERLSALVQVDAPRGGAKDVDEFRPPAGGVR